MVPIQQMRHRLTPTRTAWCKGHFWKVGDKKDTESRWLAAWMDALSTRNCTKEKKKAAALPPAFPVNTLSVCWWRTPARLKHIFTGGRWRRAYSEDGYWILIFCTAGWKNFYSQAKAKLQEHSKWHYCRAEHQQSWAGMSRLGDRHLRYAIMPRFRLFCHFMVPSLGQYSLLQRVNLLMLRATEDSFLIIQ